jgi:Fe-Mn family superoxide dismutase
MPSKLEAKKFDSIMRDLDGISARTMTEHYKLYQGYINKYNEIIEKLANADRASANQTFSDIRSLKVDLTFAIGGVKNHELYFGHLGGKGGDAPAELKRQIEQDFGSFDAWKADLKATGMAGRGWAWAAYDWDERRLINYVGDAQNTFPIWNATPLVALDVYEHAYFLDYQTDRASYIEAFFRNLDWSVVNGWIAAYGIGS